MKLNYINFEDYSLPNLTVNNYNDVNIGKYGLIILNHLKTNKKILYHQLLMKDKLTNYLVNVDVEAQNRVNNIVKELSEKEKVDENLKENDQLKWVGLMNNFKNIVEEIVLNDYISDNNL